CLVGRQRNAILRGERRQGLTRLVQNLDSQFTLWIDHVDEQMFSTETHWPRHQRTPRFFRVHRSEPVTTERRQSCRQSAGLVPTRPTRSPADVEVEFVAHDQESAARGLNIVGIPVALLVGHGAEGPPVRTGPMPSVAAVAQHNIVWLVTVRGLAPPNREEPD